MRYVRHLRADEEAVQQAADIDIHHRDRAVMGEGGDRARRVRPDAGQRLQLRDILRHAPAMHRDDRLRQPLQVDRPPVVAEAGPRPDHVARWRIRERLDGRELRQPRLPLRDDAVHLRLLQHQFGDENRVRIPHAPPRQVAPLPRVPVEQRLLDDREIGHIRRGDRRRGRGCIHAGSVPRAGLPRTR